MKEELLSLYERWCQCAVDDEDLVAELAAMKTDEARIEDAFYTELAFGTAGIRGVLGAGTNRMNIYVVAQATQGLANYILNHFEIHERRVAIGYDSRIKSKLFAETAAGVLAANGIRVYIYPELMPVPCLSFAVRRLHCAAGIMVTASHNPSEYNGYKAYGPDGCQLGETEAGEVLDEIRALDVFDGAVSVPFEDGLDMGMISYIDASVFDEYVAAVRSCSVIGDEEINRGVSIVYTPLNGAGLKPNLRVFAEAGFTNVTVVAEQAEPDGHFPTCPYPNPEIRQAMQLGIEYAARLDADLLIATDPDSDRVGIAVRDTAAEDEYILLTGNQTGVLLADFICARRQAAGILPEDAVIIKSIVTTNLADKVAEGYGVKTLNVLTGFKYIGEQIARLEEDGRADAFLFGFEESYGYLVGTHARDKDAVVATMMIAEMFAYYKTRGISLPDKLNEIYARYGYCLNRTEAYSFMGSAGFSRMQEIMNSLHEEWGRFVPGQGQSFLGREVASVQDFLKEGVPGMAPGTPVSNMLRLVFTDGNSVIIRPSGTEPKLKAYLTFYAADRAEAEALCGGLEKDIKEFMQ